MRRSTLLLFVVVGLGTGGVACGGGGGSGTSTFEEEGFAITFEYPSSFEELEDVTVASTAGARAAESRALGLDGQNLILVDRYDLSVSITPENLAQVKPEADQVVSQAAGTELSGKEVEFGGLPGLEYTFDVDQPPNASSRFVILFHENTEYAVNCQWTPARREEVQDACARALSTIAVA